MRLSVDADVVGAGSPVGEAMAGGVGGGVALGGPEGGGDDDGGSVLGGAVVGAALLGGGLPGPVGLAGVVTFRWTARLVSDEPSSALTSTDRSHDPAPSVCANVEAACGP